LRRDCRRYMNIFVFSCGIICMRMQNGRKNHNSEDNGFASWVYVVKYVG